MIQEANLQWRYYDTETNLLFPWYTLPCLQWLKEQGVEEWSVFEYGAGYSTCWWRANAFFHFAVEDDVRWSIAMDVRHENKKEDYIEKLSAFEINCVIVDGKWREECAIFASEHLLSGGIMIIDNWDNLELFDFEKCKDSFVGWTIEVFQQSDHRFWKTAVLKKP